MFLTTHELQTLLEVTDLAHFNDNPFTFRYKREILGGNTIGATETFSILYEGTTETFQSVEISFNNEKNDTTIMKVNGLIPNRYIGREGVVNGFIPQTIMSKTFHNLSDFQNFFKKKKLDIIIKEGKIDDSGLDELRF